MADVTALQVIYPEIHKLIPQMLPVIDVVAILLALPMF